MRIIVDDLQHPAVQALIREHLDSMYAQSPPESVHALDQEKLRAPGITFWSAWDGNVLLGCSALKMLDCRQGEIKSMRTQVAQRRRGVGKALLAHIIEEAKLRAYDRLSLETGSMAAFEPARKLYESFGFIYCGPFGDYREDPYSRFMCLRLQPWLYFLCASLSRH
jgi:putative acetyltransferase